MKRKKIIYLLIICLLFVGCGKEEKIKGKKTEKNVDIKENNKQINEEIIGQKEENVKIVAIDPGHQAVGNNDKEPIGPGATEEKAKVTTGATGVYTGQKESELNLKVSLILKEELEKRGYKVVMIRTTQDVDISNMERAKIANEANADAFIRIHANSYSDESVSGVLTMCQTPNNIYNGNLSEKSCLLSEKVVNNVSKETGFINKGVSKSDTMSGINWCTVPVTIVEMGFLSNINEDKLMATEEYQKKISTGIANGIDEYLNDL